MYKLIVSDLDETLLRDDGTVAEQDLQCIKDLTAKGVKFVPNSGRGFASIRNLLKKIGTVDQDGQYVISYNGGVIVNNYQNQILVSHFLDWSIANCLYVLAHQRSNLGIHVYTLNDVYIYNPSASELAYLQTRRVQYHDFNEPDLAVFKNTPIVKIIMENTDHQQLADFKAQALSEIAKPLTVAYSSNRYVEFNPAEVNKGRATLELANQLQIKPEEIIAIGDNSNDLSMLKAAGMGISVQNGIAEVKATANLILSATNNEKPITEIYQHFFG
ncbi:Cof-type HAD-IIB family hydrolase [Lapidilactobacillus bayanensis]|uniref:Cof-type HAD-IIB family hydrolase n=1 Tax=Lapidilactobacillus bayanensis TaxID=2485998 RepID=UPI000F782AFB|nr:Cof-type HAD-IIB family hydrolase [Lapidilactobacillus bayanensis]